MKVQLQEKIKDVKSFLSDFDYIITPNKFALPKGLSPEIKIIELFTPIKLDFLSEYEIQRYIHDVFKLDSFELEYSIGTLSQKQTILDEFFLYAKIDKISHLDYKCRDIEFITNFIKDKTKPHKNEVIRQGLATAVEKIKEIIHKNPQVKPKFALLDITNTEQPEIRELFQALNNQDSTLILKNSYQEANSVQKYNYNIVLYDNLIQKEYALKNLKVYKMGGRLFHEELNDENIDNLHIIQKQNNSKTGFHSFEKFNSESIFEYFKEELNFKQSSKFENKNIEIKKLNTIDFLSCVNNIYNKETNIHQEYEHIDIVALNIVNTLSQNILKTLEMPDVKVKKINFIKHILSRISTEQQATIHIENSVFKSNRILFEKLLSMTNGNIIQYRNNFNKNLQDKSNNKTEASCKFPRQISPTSINKLNKNPFSFYIQECIGLKPKIRYFQEDIFAFGKAIHNAIEEFSNKIHKNNHTPTIKMFMEIATKKLSNEKIHIHENLLYKLKTYNIAKEIVKLENNAIEKGYNIFNEQNIHIFISPEVKIYGKVDRIERFGDECRMIDFKTGDITKHNYNSEKSGKATQLAIYAINENCTELKYLRISGEKTEEKTITQNKNKDVKSLSSFVFEQIKNVIKFYETNNFKYKKLNFADCNQDDIMVDLIVREKVIL